MTNTSAVEAGRVAMWAPLRVAEALASGLDLLIPCGFDLVDDGLTNIAKNHARRHKFVGKTGPFRGQNSIPSRRRGRYNPALISQAVSGSVPVREAARQEFSFFELRGGI